MKKLLCILLTMLLSCTAAFAEATDQSVTLESPAKNFTIKATLPQGLSKGQVVLTEDYAAIDFDNSDNTACSYILIVAPSEEYANKNLSDLSDDERNAILSIMVADCDQVDYGTVTLENGNTMLYYTESGAADMGNILDVHDGYFIQLTYVHNEATPILESDMLAAEALMNTLIYEEIQ
ncbi:MAG: hypothetical protein PHI98_11945 [Eubacteriales bacterium]|nr:hypothetical protein [Eubacteriales bacterium]